MIGSALIVEVIFGIPGLGTLTAQAILSRQYGAPSDLRGGDGHPVRAGETSPWTSSTASSTRGSAMPKTPTSTEDLLEEAARARTAGQRARLDDRIRTR
jgi:hypothetical protein